jgi:hypothetical protein
LTIENDGARNPIGCDLMPVFAIASSALAEIFVKLFRRDLRQQEMVITMHADLVTARFHLANQIGRAFGNPAENEERRANVVAIEQVENARRVGPHAAGRTCPNRRA